MRDWNTGLVTLLSGTEITRCFLATLTNDVGAVVRLTSHDFDLTVGVELFHKTPGFTLSRYTVKDGGAPATLDIQIPFDADGPIYDDHVRRGAWRGGRITVWITNYLVPSQREILGKGWVGTTRFSSRIDGQLELVTKADKLRDIFLPTLQPKCDYEFTGTYCQVNAATHTRSGSVTAVTNRRKFTITVTSPGTLNFSKGRLHWTSGPNAGAKEWVRNWNATTGVTDMVTDFPFTPVVGNTFSILAGCEQDRAACKAYNNLVRFPGYDFVIAE